MARFSILVLLLLLGTVAWAKAPACDGAEEKAYKLKSWQEVYRYFKEYRGWCIDGALGEGLSESVTRLIDEQWARFDELARRATQDRLFAAWVEEEFEGDPENECALVRAVVNLETDCPNNSRLLCQKLASRGRMFISQENRDRCFYATARGQKESRLRLIFPALSLATDDGERVESIELTLSCGRFRGVRSIPDDWSLEVISPSSEVTTLKAAAGHGSTALWNLDEFNGSVEITIDEKSCFDISGVVVSATSDKEFRHEMKRSQLSLKPTSGLMTNDQAEAIARNEVSAREPTFIIGKVSGGKDQEGWAVVVWAPNPGPGEYRVVFIDARGMVTQYRHGL